MAAPVRITTGPGQQQPVHRRGWLLVLARCALAVAGGILLYLSFPPREWWWLAPVAFALLGLATHDRRARAGFGYGYLFGVAFLYPLLRWVGEYVGLIATVPLVAAEALFLALAGAGVAVTSRLPAPAVWAACCWIAAEALRARVPFGGFPWGKVAFGQPDGLFLPLATLGGTALLGFAVVLCGFALGTLIRRTVRHRARGLTVPAVLVIVPVLGGLAAAPLVGAAAQAGTATVAVIQGDVPRAGLKFNAQRRAVLENHVEVTMRLAAAVAAGERPQPDLVIWPENSSDIDPLRNPYAGFLINRAAERIGAPILVGAVLQTGDGLTTTNTMLVWKPGVGPVDRHDKQHLQPFGEYLPGREFFGLFTDKVELIGHFVPGEGDGVVRMAGIPVGVATCYEVIFDDLVRESVRSGAQLLAVPSNNATFGYTDMTYQQLAVSRVRAVEHGRAVLVAATSGASAIIRPDGSVARRTDLFVPAALVAEVPLRTETTLATRLGDAPEWLLTALGVGAVLVGAVRARRGTADDREARGR